MATETLLPDAVIGTPVGYTVTLLFLLNIDEGVGNADNTWTSADESGATEVILGFPTPTDTLTTGADLQTFRAVVRKNATGGNNPTVQIVVYENGNSTNISSNDITVNTTGTGQTISFTWNANVLAALSGANVEIGIIQTGGAGGRRSNRRYVEVDTAEWIADYTVAPVGGGAYSFSTFF